MHFVGASLKPDTAHDHGRRLGKLSARSIAWKRYPLRESAVAWSHVKDYPEKCSGRSAA
jgi:hypothetical protein